MQKIMDAKTANGSCDGVISAEGGWYKAVISGTWDGATVTMESGPDDVVYESLGSDAVLTESGQVGFFLVKDEYVRATVSSAGASTSLSVWIERVGNPPQW